MEARELRRGGIIQTTNNNGTYTCIVKEILENGVNVSVIGQLGIWFLRYEEISGIELTEELLVKCGFTLSKPRSGIQASFVIKKINVVRINLSYSNNFYYGQKYIGSLHQLQNIVFALTGHELEIKL